MSVTPNTAYAERRKLASRRSHELAAACRRASAMLQEAPGNATAYLSYVAQDLDDTTGAVNDYRVHDWDLRKVIISVNDTRNRVVAALYGLGYATAAVEVRQQRLP